MESEGMNLLRNSTVLISIFIGACMLLLVYILKQLNADQKNVDDKPKNERPLEQAERKKETATTGKGKKKGAEGRWTGRSDKQTYAHPWLLTSLKAHSAQVLDMDYASNGKYLASCAEEEPDLYPVGDLGLDGGSTSSGTSDSNRESSLPSSATPSPRTKGLSRRQRKNRRRDDHSPPEIKKRPKGKRAEPAGNRKLFASSYEPLEYYIKLKQLKLPEDDWTQYIQTYTLEPKQQLMNLGYPVASQMHNGQIFIFKSPMTVPVQSQNSTRYNKINVKESKFDVNAQEFVPGMDYFDIKAEWNANHDSGQGSGCSSDSGEGLDDSEESTSTDGDLEPRLASKKYENPNKTYFVNAGSRDGLNVQCVDNSANDYATKTSNYQCIDKNQCWYGMADERPCARCGQCFFISKGGKYVTQDHCEYHWGKLQNAIAPTGKHHKSYGYVSEYSCCKGKPDSRGCTVAKLHVWTGVAVGFNGPLENFVRTRPRKSVPPDGNYGVYALDCEMCYTAMGLEVTKISVVGTDGRLVYDSFIKPDNEIVDYNTRFSGITAKDLNRKGAVKTLREVQNDLMGFISAQTILIGHGLENDLRVLKIVHELVVDTAITFPHHYGLPYKRSLKSLTSYFLKQDIQCGVNGHDSVEDARACMELVLCKVVTDYKALLNCYYSE